MPDTEVPEPRAVLLNIVGYPDYTLLIVMQLIDDAEI